MDELEALCQLVVDQAEQNPHFREKFLDLVRERMTGYPPNSEAYAELKKILDGMEKL